MKVVTAPESYTPAHNDVLVFLAGGITGCDDWQQKVIDTLALWPTQNLVILNPRRKNFPMDDPSAGEAQIEWEFNWLEKCDIFSMYFAGGESVQPICMYELGRNLVRMQMRYPLDWDNRLVINVAPDCKRKFDVVQQVKHARGMMYNANGMSPEDHAFLIRQAYRYVRDIADLTD